MLKFMQERKRKPNNLGFDDSWLDVLDDDSKQETVIKYLRSLTNSSLKNLYDAVELYRQGDKILKKVKDPEPEVKTSEEQPDEQLLSE